jgi:succinoglycan biosynthesis transport protein ExoP
MSFTVVLEILDRITKSWWTVIAGLCLGLAASTAAMYYLPKVYEAQTTIFVVPQGMSDQLVRSTVTDDMSTRLSALREAVISRPYMVQLIAENYGEIEDQAELERLINSISSRVKVGLMRIDPRRGGGMFQLSFSDGDAERSADVVNALAQLYIAQNVQFRTNQAGDTANTMQELADEVGVQLQALDKDIAAFKERHLYDTSEHFDANLQQMSASRQELEINGRALAQARDSLQAQLIQQEQVEWMTASLPESMPTSDPIRAQYVRLRSELADLKSRYQEDHPDVRRKQQELDEFLDENSAVLKIGEEGGGENAQPAPPTTPLMAQIDASRREITRLEAEAGRIQGDIDEYKRRIERTPRVDQELTELTKNHGVLQDKYRTYMAKYEDARASLRVEESQQGERFEIIEEARAARLPSKPVPLMVYGLGLIGGFMLFVGPIVANYFLVPTIVSESGLKELSEYPVLITINQLQTPYIERLKRSRKLKNVLASMLAMTVLAVVTALYFWKIYL